MKVALALVALALLLAGPGQASMSDRALAPVCQTLGQPPGECSLNYDGGKHGDAPDSCGPVAPALLLNGPAAEGLLLPVDDPADYYDLAIPASAVGRSVTVTLTQGLGAPPNGIQPPRLAAFDVAVFRPNCTTPADVVVGGDSYTFIPPFAGKYHVRVTLQVALLPAAGGAGEPGADVCHATCFGDGVNPALGYRAVARSS